jgi:hypothetical protein
MLFNYLDKTPREKWNYRLIARTADIIEGRLSDEWYGKIFALAQDDQVCGEVTPEYSLLPAEGIRHILRLAPAVKVLLSLRDPIDRNWSHIRMLARSQPEGATIDLRRIAEFADIRNRADYPAIIARWTAELPKDQLLITFLDDIVINPRAVMKDVCNYLEIDYKDEIFPRLSHAVHVGEELKIPAEIYEYLKAQLRPIYDELLQLFTAQGEQWFKRHYDTPAQTASYGSAEPPAESPTETADKSVAE